MCTKRNKEMSNLNNVTNDTQDWTVEKLVNFRKYMANAFCPGITQDKSIDETDTWTTESLIRMSASLARAYCPGL